MTEHEKKEIEEFLLAKGLSKTAVKVALNSAELDSLCEQYKNSDEGKRYQELRTFEPNPGKAKLTPVGKVHEGITYLEDPNPYSDKEKMFRSEYEMKKTDGNIPVYQEDIDMVKKSIPLAKKILDLQKKREDVGAMVTDAYNLPQGPDTTECINEITEPVDDPDSYTFYWNDVQEKSHKDEKTPDVMWYFDPESERFKPVIEHETDGLQGKGKQCNKNVSKDEDKIKESFEKTQEANICTGIRRDEDPREDYSYSSILRQMDETHTRKNNDYGDAAYQGYRKYGDPYFLVQLHNKLSRLESLTINNRSQMVKDESIDDTLLDMANYAVMYLESRHRND